MPDSDGFTASADATDGATDQDGTPESLEPSDTEVQDTPEPAESEPESEPQQGSEDAPAEPENAAEEAPAEDDDGTALVESLKQSLRATTAERNRLRDEARGLREQLQQPQPPEPIPPQPQVDGSEPPQSTDADGRYQRISRLADPELAGLLYDKTDDTVCIGDDPENFNNWVTPDIARAVVSHRRMAEQQQQLQQQRVAQEQVQALREVSTRYETTAQQLRERLIPNVQTDAAKGVLDQMIIAETARRMGVAGITEGHIARMDTAALEKASEILHEVVKDARSLVVELSRAELNARERAAEREPVPATGGSAATPIEKDPADLSQSEQRNYIVDAFRRFKRGS